jgi:hypothetical protein
LLRRAERRAAIEVKRMSQITGLTPQINDVQHTTSSVAGLVVVGGVAPPALTTCEPETKSAPPPQRPPPSSVTISPDAAEQIKELVGHLYRLGVRPVFEAFCAIHGGADVIDTLAAYQRLDPAVVAYLGADRLPRRRCKGARS